MAETMTDERKSQARAKLDQRQRVAMVGIPQEERQAIEEQALAILAEHDDLAVGLVLSGHAQAGRGYTPLSGYVAGLHKKARFVAGHYDLAQLFKGRCMTPLLALRTDAVLRELARVRLDGSTLADAAIRALQNNEWLDRLENAEHTALDAVRASDTYLTLARSEATTSSLSIVVPAAGGVPWLVYEAHALPDGALRALGSNTDAASLTVLAEEMELVKGAPLTVDEFFFNPVMQNYYASQKAYRALVCRLVRRAIVEAVLGDQAAVELRLDTQLTGKDQDDVHFVTNTANERNDGTFVYYSETLEATLPGGAYVDAGPFNESIWVNSDGTAVQALLQAGLYSMIPYATPMRFPRADVLERIVARRIASKEQSRDAEGIITIRDGSGTFTLATIKSSQPRVFEISHPISSDSAARQEGIVASMMRRDQTARVVWREAARVPVAIPDEMVNYHLSVADIQDTLKTLGIDVRQAHSHVPLVALLTVMGAVSVVPQLELWKAYMSNVNVAPRNR